jgi:hypothetical protein
MNKILGSLLLLGLTFLSAGNITATVDTEEIIEGDSVLLTLSVVGKNIDNIPDIEEINGVKVESVQRRSGTNFVHVNGVSSMEHTQILILEFRPDQNMTIPAFSAKVDGEIKSTNPINVTISKSATGMKRSTKHFSLDVQLSKSTFYLGESIVLNVYFKQRTQIDVMQIDYTPPKFKDFFSKQIGDGKTYRKGAYTIQELNYLLIAKKAGKLALEPARAKVARRSRERQRGGWYIDVPKWTQLSSPSLVVEVIEPTEAHDIVGDYRLTDRVDHKKVKANKPVTFRMELLGKGTLDDYDGIKFDIPGVTIYSDDAKVESTLLGKDLQSRYVKSFVFISNHDFVIPSKEIRVYDYKLGKVKILKTKAYHIEIEGATKIASSPVVHTKNPVHKIVNVANDSTGTWLNKFPSILALLLAFALGVFVTMFFKLLPKVIFPNWKRKENSFRGDEALRVLYPKMSENKEVEAMVRKLYALKCGEKNVKIDKEKLKELVEQYK